MRTTTRRDWQRWARYGSTTARGYGHQHQAERNRRLKQYRPGDPCAHCGQPITWPLPLTKATRRYIHLPHNASRTGYLAGLAHSTCNLRDGQRASTATRYGTRPVPALPLRTSRQW